MKKKSLLFTAFLFVSVQLYSGLLIPMDKNQTAHLKAYGLAYHALQEGLSVHWLLNYRGGSFLFNTDSKELSDYARLRNISYETVSASAESKIESIIEEENMTDVKLETAPRIAVYAPSWNAPWDDAVTLALKYAEIPYETIWDEEVAAGVLQSGKYDWLHLHHEDFTGQFGKFWYGYGREKWYIEQVALFEKIAVKLGYKTVQEEKKAIAQKIRDFVENGGFLFAMCSACDTLDIGLASKEIDIIPAEIDGTPADPAAQSKLDFSQTFAFENFTLNFNSFYYGFSDINIDPAAEGIYNNPFYFDLNEFAAKYDTVASMLVQNHVNRLKGFLGQTTAFKSSLIKKNVTVLSLMEGKDYAIYIHGDRGKGTFTFLGGHDPEDYAHKVGDSATDLDLFPNSPGYRLILNNVLFPASKEKKKKT